MIDGFLEKLGISDPYILSGGRSPTKEQKQYKGGKKFLAGSCLLIAAKCASWSAVAFLPVVAAGAVMGCGLSGNPFVGLVGGMLVVPLLVVASPLVVKTVCVASVVLCVGFGALFIGKGYLVAAE